jgi:DNA-binding response OmpR family regulator
MVESLGQTSQPAPTVRPHRTGGQDGGGARLTVPLRQPPGPVHRPRRLRTVKRILVVDDEPNIVELLRLYLEKEGFAVVAARDGDEALVLHARHDPDLVVLDLMLPKRDGFEVCRELRRRGDTPILMLTARSDDVDAIVGLELGADDYVTKPFNPRTLVARVKAILRRTAATTGGGRPMEVGSLRVDPRRREAYVGDRRLDLRPREFDLLAALARDPGVVLTRDALLEDAWGTDFPGETRTVDVHVAEVRKKLGADGPPIETVRGVGYRLVPPAREPLPPVGGDAPDGQAASAGPEPGAG